METDGITTVEKCLEYIQSQINNYFSWRQQNFKIVDYVFCFDSE